MNNPKRSHYYSNSQQVMGAFNYSLCDGKANGLKMIKVRNGLGLDFDICPEKCCDIERATFKGSNISYLSPAGFVSPKYYDARECEMLRSFTGGLLYTAGLDNVGNPCVVDGTSYPLHGHIGSTPATTYHFEENEKEITIFATMNFCAMALENLELQRKIIVSKLENKLRIEDKITNLGTVATPVMILYHMNFGYPLLSENSILDIPSVKVTPRTDFAEKMKATYHQIEKPESITEEVCYFHEFDKKPKIKLFNPDISKGIEMRFDNKLLKYFTQWKLMTKYDYVLGLEPGNCLPIGRKEAINKNMVPILKENENVNYWVEINFVEE